MDSYINQDSHESIRELLLGRKVVKVVGNLAELDNGTTFEVMSNEGCGGCGAGWYDLDELNECDNIITAVEFRTEGNDISMWNEEYTYKVFVVAEDRRINLFAVTGDDGNGWYGTGYSLVVKDAALRGNDE